MAASSTTLPLPKIVGGRPAPKDAYPWMTALILRGQTPVKGQFCGGALIHPQWVLSAAHCVEDMSASALDVMVGGYDLRSSTDGTRVSVSQIVIHPRFSTVKGALVNDVALLKLSQPLTGVPVLSLVDAVSQVAPGTPVKGMGWGTTSEAGRQSPILLEVDMNLVSLTEASEVYPGLSEVHLAAGVPGGGRDTCQGDSGGPLV
jgi:secreted trypsin-like serine protease